MGCKWIFKLKEGIGSVEPSKYKARLAIKCFTQKKRVDFNEVFSFVIKK